MSSSNFSQKSKIQPLSKTQQTISKHNENNSDGRFNTLHLNKVTEKAKRTEIFARNLTTKSIAFRLSHKLSPQNQGVHEHFWKTQTLKDILKHEILSLNQKKIISNLLHFLNFEQQRAQNMLLKEQGHLIFEKTNLSHETQYEDTHILPHEDPNGTHVAQDKISSQLNPLILSEEDLFEIIRDMDIVMDGKEDDFLKLLLQINHHKKITLNENEEDFNALENELVPQIDERQEILLLEKLTFIFQNNHRFFPAISDEQKKKLKDIIRGTDLDHEKDPIKGLKFDYAKITIV